MCSQGWIQTSVHCSDLAKVLGLASELASKAAKPVCGPGQRAMKPETGVDAKLLSY